MKKNNLVTTLMMMYQPPPTGAVRPTGDKYIQIKPPYLLLFSYLLDLVLSFMSPQILSWPKSFITEAAWDVDSFEMIFFNVIFYGVGLAFLSTNLTHFSKLLSIGNSVLAVLHLWFHHVVKFLKVHRIVSRNGQCSTLYSPRLWIFMLGACLHNGQEIFRLQPSCSL